MRKDCLNPQKDRHGILLLVPRILFSILCGSLLGAGLYWIIELAPFWILVLKGLWLFVLSGALLGGLIGLCWKTFTSLWIRFRSENWQVTEIEIDTFGQKLKLANSGSQRRVAWSIFVEIMTRIATQQMLDSEGDDGIAIKSLSDLFQSTRKSISEIKSTSVLPSSKGNFDTVETYSLAMLNKDIRPFLSKWHPVWDTWRKSNPNTLCFDWDLHLAFRIDLKSLQSKIQERAKGLGEIAGVPEIDQFMKMTTHLDSDEQD